MKPRLFSMVMPAVAIGGMTLLLGCDEDSKKQQALGSAATSVAPVIAAAPNLADTVPALPVPPVTTNPVPASTEPPPKDLKAPTLSAPAEKVVQLAQAGLSEEVLLAYVEASTNQFDLQVDHILYLHDLGLPTPVISAMVRRGQPATDAEPPDSTPTVADTPIEAADPVAEAAPGSSNEPPQMASTEEVPKVEAPSQPVTYNYFYNNLASYGTWLDDPTYGWCWRPSAAVINVGWRPYCDNGRWLWTDSGWYWQSSYSWGYIPFHYGRWCYRPTGWLWVPGTVWGPSWVTWCYSGSYAGWAPLPPECGYTAGVGLTFSGAAVGVGFGFGLGYNCWTFVPAARVCKYPPRSECLPLSRVPVVINNGTIVNNYTRGSGNNTVINVGIGVDRVAAASRSEVRRVALRDVDATPGTVIKADRLDRSGSSLAVYRPALSQQATPRPSEQIIARQEAARARTESLIKPEAARLARTGVPASSTVTSRPVRPASVGTPPTSAPIRAQSASTLQSGSAVRQDLPVMRNEVATRPAQPGTPVNTPTPSRNEVRKSGVAVTPWTAPQTPSPVRNEARTRPVTPQPSVGTPVTPRTPARNEPYSRTPVAPQNVIQPHAQTVAPAPVQPVPRQEVRGVAPQPGVTYSAPSVRPVQPQAVPRAQVPQVRSTPPAVSYSAPQRSVAPAPARPAPAPNVRSSPPVSRPQPSSPARTGGGRGGR